MKVLYDYQIFQMQRFGGISNSFVNLIDNMSGDFEYEIGIKDSDNVHLKQLHLANVESEKTVNTYLGNGSYIGKGLLARLVKSFYPSVESEYRNRVYSEMLLRQGNFDVFHPTYFSDYFTRYIGRKPFVLTVHDMIPELLNLNDPLQIKWKKKLVPLASHIVTVSNQTKIDLIDMMKVPDSKITVIYHGSPQPTMAKFILPQNLRYFLYVGRRDEYKGFQMMVEALQPILKDTDIFLVCTGPAFTKEELLYICRKGLKGKILSVIADDQEMVGLYSRALCFIYPSQYEGFGIPILEAYNANCPVILNNASCFPEIADDAAVYFHTSSDGSTDLNEVMNRFLKLGSNERDALLQRQRIRLKTFSWKKSAEQLAQVYRMVCE